MNIHEIMRYLLHLASALLILLLVSCGTHREIMFDSHYWRHMEKGTVYETVQSVGVTTERLHSLTGYDMDRWDMRLHQSRHFQQRGPNLPAGTLIQAKAVYKDSKPLQHTSISYGGEIVGGQHNGKRVDFTQLLQSDYPDPKYLLKVTSSDAEQTPIKKK